MQSMYIVSRPQSYSIFGNIALVPTSIFIPSVLQSFPESDELLGFLPPYPDKLATNSP